MDDTNRDETTTSHNDSDARPNTEFNGGQRQLNAKAPVPQKRTRSQLNVPDLILRLPLSRSPLKAAKKARAKERGVSPTTQSFSRTPSPGASQSPIEGGGDVQNVALEARPPETAPEAEEEEEMDTSASCRAEKHEEEEGTEPEGEMPTAGARGERSKSPHARDVTPPTGSKKRASPDTDTVRVHASGNERTPKRAKLDAFRMLGRKPGRPEHLEYEEPLRDPDTRRTPKSRGFTRAASAKPTPSPSKVASSIFRSRAKSVPPEGESDVRSLDLTAIPPSPRRSPAKTPVEIRRAPSLPPPDSDSMDIDSSADSSLLHFTNATTGLTPRANPTFNFTVNFATPCGSTPPEGTSLSPLTPLPPTPFVDRLPAMQSFLAKRANSRLKFSFNDSMDTDDNPPPASSDIPPSSEATSSMGIPQPPTTDPPSRPSSAASISRPASVSSLSSLSSQQSQSYLPRPIAKSSSNSTELMPPPPVPEKANGNVRPTGLSIQSKTGPSISTTTEGIANPSNNKSTDSSVGSRLQPTAPAAQSSARRGIVGAMKPKRGPSVPPGPRRVTRSVSMKEQRVKGDRDEIKAVMAAGDDTEDSTATTSTAAGPATDSGMMPPPSTTIPSKLRPPKSTGPSTSRLKTPLASQKPTPSTSTLKPPPDSHKMKQTSLNFFMKSRPHLMPNTSVDGSASSTPTSSGSRGSHTTSPSKIPLPLSPAKRPTTTQTSGKPKPFSFAFGSTSSSSGSDVFGGKSGRSLSTLSHALDKLAAPPPSRPNTSMGFVRSDEAGATDDDSSTAEDNKGKGKGKARDDTSLPTTTTQGSTFARPTASSLKRAATVMNVGTSAAARMKGRGGHAGGAGAGAGVGMGMGGRGRGGTIGIFGRAGERASKKTTLPVVEGSPVKGGGKMGDADRDSRGASRSQSRLSLRGAKPGEDVSGDEHPSSSQDAAILDGDQDAVMEDVSAETNGSAAARKPSPPSKANKDPDIDLTMSPTSIDKGKQRAAPPSTLNPASSALHALSESLSSLPQTPTPPKPRAVGTRTGLRSSSAAVGKESPAIDGSGSAGPGGSEVHGSGGAGPSSGAVNVSGGAKKSSLKVLKRCSIFVDVRTEQGDDAGSLFVDMLKGLGAKIMGRIGQSCTHIVYKNGLPNTLTRYRLLNDPKPFVVGIAWVVECVEKRARVDEERFKIDVDVINVAGSNKRRRSMLPKHLIPHSPNASIEMMNMSSEADDDEEGGGAAVNGSPSQDPDISIRSRDEDDLPPLERARRRRSILPGGQTRLIP